VADEPDEPDGPDRQGETCALCAIHVRMDAGDDPWAVARLSTGYVALNADQFYEGYTFFSCRDCVVELDDLEGDRRARFLHEMSEVAAAVRRAFRPRKMNYEALGNFVPHLHWHLVPRHADDPRPHGPIWEDLDHLRRSWTAPDPVSDDRRRDLVARLLAELHRADVTIEAVLADPTP
jgi:diadenosine tetraphosphate (Ap4A) HIT family hydrolase